MANKFVWDDEELIVNNQAIHDISNWSDFLTATGFNSYQGTEASGIYFKPLQTLVYSIAWNLAPGEVFYFHLIQIALFILNAFLIFKLFKYLLDSRWALILSLIFLVHPLNSETSIYIANLQDALYFFWGMVALLIFIELRSSAPAPSEPVPAPRETTITSRKHLFLNFLIGPLLLLSLLSKESGILFFCTITAALMVFGFKEWRNKVVLFSGLLISVIGYFILRISFAGLNLHFGHLSPISRASFYERLLSFPKIFSYYINNLFYPFNLEIGQHWVVSQIDFDFYLYVAEFLVIILLMSYLLIKKFSRASLFFYLCFWGGLLFHSQILFPLDLTVATRWFYFPFFCLLGFVGSLATSYKIKVRLPVALAVIAALAVMTFYRTLDWKDDLTLFRHDIVSNPRSFDLNNNLGTVLFREGNIKEACSYFEKSTQLAPHWWTNWNNLGVCYQRFQQYDLAEQNYLKAIQQGHYFLAVDNLISLYLYQNKNDQARQILNDYGLKYFPENEKIKHFKSILAK